MSQILSGHRPKVFISYRRKTSAMLATLIASHLQEQGIDPYVDTRESGGGPFPDRLLQAIQDSDVFVSLLADDTLESEWVLREIEHAHSLNKPMIPVFQESFVRPDPLPNEHVVALMRYDGVHILDVKNLYVDQAMNTLTQMIWKSVGEAPPSSRRMLWLAGGVSLLVALIALVLFLGPIIRGKVDTPTLPVTTPPASATLDELLQLETIEAGETATAVAPVIAQTRAYAQTRIAAYQTNVAATVTATFVTATMTPTPTSTPVPSETAPAEPSGGEQPTRISEEGSLGVTTRRPPSGLPDEEGSLGLSTRAAVDFEVLQLRGTLDAGGSVSQLEIQNYQQIFEIASENLIVASDAGSAPDVNLTISGVGVTPENPSPGQAFQLEVRVENIGNDDSGPFDVQWFASELLEDTFSQTVANLASGESTILSFSYSYGWWGTYSSTLWIDPANVISETDETDNVQSLEITTTNEPIVIDFDTLPNGDPITPPHPIYGDEFLANNIVFAPNEDQCPDGGTLMIETLLGQNALRSAPPCPTSLLVHMLQPVG
ncbi:MAG: TIR domain-containing protein, partial [Burkholderiales bacterium]|nr:TIR domain-containing protein [Anaerolineae bacterium]